VNTELKLKLQPEALLILKKGKESSAPIPAKGMKTPEPETEEIPDAITQDHHGGISAKESKEESTSSLKETHQVTQDHVVGKE